MGATYNGLGSHITAWMAGLITKAESLLSPVRMACVACNASYTKRRELALCDACMQKIPWILHVKCNHCGRLEHCPDCRRRQSQYFVQNRSAVNYSPQMKEWLALYKYRGHEKLRELLGSMLLHAYHLHRGSDESTSSGSAAPLGAGVREFISYVPLSQTRLTERGFNQARQMAEELGNKTGLPVLPILERVRHTDKQSFKSRGDRLGDLQGVFRVIPDAIHRIKESAAQSEIRLYIVDDVYTTGSTLNECARTILDSGIPVKIYGICWAR